jgi:hypothetical protein
MAKYLRAPDVEELQMVAYEEEPEPKPIATTADRDDDSWQLTFGADKP